jgi:hypothetical protein
MLISIDMIITSINEPFPYLLVEDFYKEDELDLIWKELAFLVHPNKLVHGSYTNPEVNSKGHLIKNNRVHYLDAIYKVRNISSILTLSQKLFIPEIIEEFCKLSFGYNSIKKCNTYDTQLGYYENADYYHSHSDSACYTALTWLFKEPKQFSGGDLTFTDYDHTINIKNNMTVLFPSFVMHEVDRIIMDSSEFNHGGRHVIAQFVKIKDS